MPDFVPGNITSTVPLPFGAPINGEIETLGDHDFYRITLTAGQTYTFLLNGRTPGGGDTTLADSVLRLVNSVGTQVAINDDAGPNDFLSQIIYTPTVSGTYYLDVGAFRNEGTGTFRVSAATSLAGAGDTIAGDFTTTGTITPGFNLVNTVNGTINTLGDHDWYQVLLTGGQAYSFRTTATGGATDVDTTLTIHNSSGTVLGYNDDGGGGTYSQLRFAPTTTGYYYIDVRGFADADTGAFRLIADNAPPLQLYTNDQIADQLINGYWGGPSGAHHFGVTTGGTITVNISALSAAGQFLAHEALALWSDITGITFAEILTAASITFTDTQSGAFTSAARTGNITTHADVNVGTGWLTTYGTTLNSYSFQTYIHEIGHALGLGHGGNYNSVATYSSDALYLNDSWTTTIQSYFDQVENTYFKNQGFSRYYAVSPQVADDLAITQIYGASTVTRTGDTVYGFGNTSGRAIYDAAANPNVSYTIFDSGGIDTLNYSGFSTQQKINLNSETFSNVGNGIGNVNIARGVVVENAVGGSGSDILIGNAAANQLSGGLGADTLSGNDGNDSLLGGGGNDILSGGKGSDTIDGGDDSDTLDYSAGEGAIFVDLAGGYALETARQSGTVSTSDTVLSTDVISNIENLQGSAYGDRIYGSGTANILDGGAGDDILYGEGGDDVLLGGLGSDVLIGGAGQDRINYATNGGAVYIELGAGFVLETELQAGLVDASTAVVSTDLLAQIEDAYGSAYEDRIYGSNVANSLFGLAGDDIIYAEGGDDFVVGGEGSDILLGGSGIDTLDYGDSFGAVFADLAGFVVETELQTGTVGAGTAALYTDLIAQFENISGTAFGDRLYGDAGANLLDGRAGDDILYGGGGADVLIGGDGVDRLIGEAGADTLTGGAGADRFIFSTAPGTGVDTITDFSSGEGDKLYFLRSAFGLAPADPLTLVLNGSAVAPHSFLYNSSTGILSYDADGASGAAAIAVADIGAGVALTTGDLVLYG